MKRQLIIVTPTWKRDERLSCMRMFIEALNAQKNLLWLIVEDGEECDDSLAELLESSGIQHRYWAVGPSRDKGNIQRNAALECIVDLGIEGVVYNGDDDNFYDPALFDELRKVQRIALFPVGNLGPSGIERPIVKSGRIVSWDAGWKERRYPVDMAGFAFCSSLLGELERPFWTHRGVGGESEFLEKMVGLSTRFEFLCNDCNTCLVWHNQALEPEAARKGFSEPLRTGPGPEEVRMRIVAPYTSSHADLAKRFVDSSQFCDIPVEMIEVDGGGEDGSFQSASWRVGIKRKVAAIRERVKSCDGSIIIASDVDIQFFKPIRKLIEEVLIERGFDMAFQAEYASESSSYNAGFIAMKCNEKVAAVYEALCSSGYDSMEMMEQEWLNLNLNRFELRHSCLPRVFWAWSHGANTLSDQIVLHHANCTGGEDSVAKKIIQLDFVERAVVRSSRHDQQATDGRRS